MKIYFACSISGEPGGQEDKDLIVATLKTLGHEVISEIFIHHLKHEERKRRLSAHEIYEQDIKWIEEADIVVADVSRISMGVGYEIGWCTAKGKQVVALCRKDRVEKVTNMIKGITASTFSLNTWQFEDDLQQLLKTALL